jgi:AcrR family transcriptional regulator
MRHNGSMNARAAITPRPSIAITRSERKRQTREALLEAALELLEDRSFGSLSLREVARSAGIVPTGFYRHFDGMEELGLALVDESFRTLRQMIRSARAGRQDTTNAIRASVAILVRHVHEHRLHFRFIARERSSGVPALRRAIHNEIRLFSSELAIDLARMPFLGDWSSEDLHMVSGLLVDTMVSTAEAILDAAPDDPAAEREIVRMAEKRLLLIALGVPRWRPSTAASGAERGERRADGPS